MKTNNETLQFAKVFDEVSVADFEPPLVTTICNSIDSVSTLTIAGMLKIY